MRKLGPMSLLDLGDIGAIALASHGSMGEVNEQILVRYLGTLYQIDALGSETLAFEWKGDLALVDREHGEAYYFASGGYSKIDIEDDGMVEFGNRIVFYSDAGLSILGRHQCRWLLLKKLKIYVIDYDFSRVSSGIVSARAGTGEVVEFSIEDLDRSIGCDVERQAVTPIDVKGLQILLDLDF